MPRVAHRFLNITRKSLRSWMLRAAWPTRAAGACAVVLCGSLLASPLASQEKIPVVGTLIDETNTTVAHAVVTIHTADSKHTPLERTLTGPNGRLSGFSLASGTYWIIVRRIGFKPDTQSLKISASNPAPPFTMVVASVPVALPTILVEATQCTQFGAFSRDTLLSRAWDQIETAVLSRAVLYQDYEYEVTAVDSSFAAERTPQWKVRSESSRRRPTNARELLHFSEPLYRISFSGNKPSLQTGSEFGLLSDAFKANHCITLTAGDANTSTDVVQFRSLPLDAKNFHVEGRIVVDRTTSRMTHFSYRISRQDVYLAEAYYTYGTTDVLGQAFPVLSQTGQILMDPNTGKTVTHTSSSPTYRAFRKARDRY